MAKGIPDTLAHKVQRELLMLQAGTKRLAVDRVPTKLGYEATVLESGYWKIWLAANKDYTLGTYAKLYDTGRLEYVTIREGEPDDITLVKE